MIWSIQALRFFAALMIVYIHAADEAARVTGSIGSIPVELEQIGNSGVDIFFVTSGLIIAKIAPGRTASEFIWSRFTRVFPIYLLFAIPILASKVWIIGISGLDWRDVVATLLLWPATDQMTGPALTVGWTLCFEMLFYTCAALVLFQRRFAFAIIGGYGIAFALRHLGPIFQFLGNPLVLEFLLGIGISFMPKWRPGIWGLPVGGILLIGVGIFGVAPTCASTLLGTGGLQRVLVFGIPAAMIVYGTSQVEARQSVWTYLGDTSYSLYLSHTYALTLLFILWRKISVPADLIVLISISVSVLFAWRIHELLEKPIMTAIRRQQPARRMRLLMPGNYGQLPKSRLDVAVRAQLGGGFGNTQGETPADAGLDLSVPSKIEGAVID
jgi:exopolysaccharide production protein ExoZ